MSDYVIVGARETSVPPFRRIMALLAVARARRLARLKPDELERRLRRISRGARSATASEALIARTTVTSVSTRCAGRWCLDRSIATALLLRLGGAWPEWHTGVCLLPFRAHAWVAVDGEPIGEPEGLGVTFRSLLVVTAGRTEH